MKQKQISQVLAVAFFLVSTLIGSLYASQHDEADKLESSQTAFVSDQTAAPEQGELYKVVKVVDGDTIDVDMNGKTERLRLIGINTPETVDPRKPVECFGKEASNKAKELLNGTLVRVQSDPKQSERDKYDRLLGYVILENGIMFNKLMISEGYAYEYTYDIPYKYQKEFKQAQLGAQQAKRGLWSESTCGGSVNKT